MGDELGTTPGFVTRAVGRKLSEIECLARACLIVCSVTEYSLRQLIFLSEYKSPALLVN